MIKHFMALISCLFVALMLVSSLSGVSAVTITNIDFSGKGAIAQWVEGSDTINAIVNMSNSGKDGKIYVSIVHRPGVSQASGNVDIKWSMNHVTVETSLYFTGPSSRTGWHQISITWQTDGQTSNVPKTVDTTHGMISAIDGSWKSGTAAITVYTPESPTGHHGGVADIYTSDWAAVVHGDAKIQLTQ